MSLKILCTVPSFSPEARPALEALGEVTYASPTNETVIGMIGEYDALIVGLGCTYSREVLDAAKKLKVIATATTGLDHIDVAYAKEKGIEILSLKGENEFLDTITGTSELAFGLMLSLMRMIPTAHDHVVKGGKWDREQFRGQSLFGKTLGIVGMGRLGKIMAQGALGFRMHIIFYDPNVEQSAFPDFKKVSFEELLEVSDVVAVHVHLSPETENMFNEQAFQKMKPHAYLINTSRGGVVDEKALIDSLEEKKLAGYGADVLNGELDFNNDASAHPIVHYAATHPNVIITPHIGGMTSDSRAATDVFMAQKLSDHLMRIKK